MPRVRKFMLGPWWLRSVTVISGMYMSYYIMWRWQNSLNYDAMPLAILLFGAEVFGAVNFFLFAFMTWDTDTVPNFHLKSGLRVDVFVPTYSEGLEVLEPTLLGCQAIRYPHRTYVLDDGRRPEVQSLAERLGCFYLTREDNKHAKAGNLNAAMGHTSGEFIAVFDADTVPQPDFLEKTLGYFVDEKVALVQLPQEFYNRDSAQHPIGDHGGAGWHEQALFYRVIQPGKNRWNAAFWCGSPSVVRRAALVDVGGVATDTITEDIHTAMRLHRRGWRTVYHKENLAYGIAPQNMLAFAVQRLRWAQGTMQILRSKENPIIAPGLSLAQRLNYCASMFTYFESYQKLIFLTLPSIIILTGQLPINADTVAFLSRWFVYYVLSLATNIALGRGQYRALRVEAFNLLKMFIFIRASTTLVWKRNLSFKVTPKGNAHAESSWEWRAVIDLILIGVFLVLSLIIGIANLQWSITASYALPEIMIVTILWGLVNCSLIAYSVRDVARRLYRRKRYRFPAHVPVRIEGASGVRAIGTTADLSEEGAGLTVRLVVPASSEEGLWPSVEPISVCLILPEGEISVEAKAVQVGRDNSGRIRMGVRFLSMSVTDRHTLMRFLFIALPRSLDSGPGGTALEPGQAIGGLDGLGAGAISESLMPPGPTSDKLPHPAFAMGTAERN